MIEELRTARLLRTLRRGTRRDPGRTERLQGGLLRDAVAHAYEHVPLYRRLWDEAGFAPDAVRGAADVGRLPVLDAGVAREAIRSGELLARGVRRERLPAYPTSGSGGHPLPVPRGAPELRTWRATALRAWLEHGYRWHQVTGQLEADAGPPHVLQRMGVSRTAWIPTELAPGEQAERLARAGAAVFAGTPTTLRRLARAIEDGDAQPLRPRVVFCQGEIVDRSSAALIGRVLGSAPVGLYGLTELGYAGWQCERRDGYHLNADTCLVEVLRDGRPARPGELGDVVATDLRGRTAPLLRYRTGDLAVAADGPCPCGRTLPLVRSVDGRSRDLLALPDGREVTPRAVVDHMAPLLAPDAYRVRQEAPGRVRLHLAAPDGGGAARRLAALLGDVEIEVVDSLPPAGTRDKARPVESALTAAPPEARA